MKKIYFCGSIRGGRGQATLYGRMIETLSRHGQVLTAHVGDPSLTELGGDGDSPDIWRRDTAWLRESDLVVAECGTPSLGVGYELAFAEALGKPVYVFFCGDRRRLSAMIDGNPHFTVCSYSGEEELLSLLEGLF